MNHSLATRRRWQRILARAAGVASLVVGATLAQAQAPVTSLQAATVYPGDAGMDVIQVVAADFNGDGISDFALVEVDPATPTQFELVVYRANSDGSFSVASHQTISGTLAGVAGGTNHVLGVGHFNGATQPPGLAIAMTTSPLCGTGGPGVYLVYAALPAASGSSVDLCLPTKDAPTSVAVGDFNGDGFDDIAVSYPAGSAIGTASIYLNIAAAGSAQSGLYWYADYAVTVTNTVGTLYGTLRAGNVGTLSSVVGGALTPATSLALVASSGPFTPQYVDVLVPFMVFNTVTQTTTLTFNWATAAVTSPSILSDIAFAPPPTAGGGALIGLGAVGAYSFGVSPTLDSASRPVMGAVTNLASPSTLSGYALAIADFDGNGVPDFAFLGTSHTLAMGLNPSASSVTEIGPFGPVGQALAVGYSTGLFTNNLSRYVIVDAGMTQQTTPQATQATVARSIAIFMVDPVPHTGQPTIAPQMSQSPGLVSSTFQPAFAVADLDGSGIPGVAVLGLDAASFAATITPFKNVIATGGTGYFTAQPVIDLGGTNTLTGPAPNGYAVVSGKFRDATANPSGLRDLAIYSSDGPTVLTNMGGFVFELDANCVGGPGSSGNCNVASESHFPGLPTPYGAVPPMLAVDVNGDGVDDIVIAVPENCTPLDALTNSSTAVRAAIYVLISNGDGTFQAPVYYPSPVANPVALAAGNILGSGHPDIVVANGGEACNTTLPTAPNPLVAVALLPNSATVPGSFGAAQAVITQASAGLFPNVSSIAVADMNLDGVPDIVASESDGLHVILSPTASIPTFTDQGAVPLYGSADSTLQNASQITIADFNRDGTPDVAAVIGGIAYVFPNVGPGNLQSPASGFAAGPNSTQALGIGVSGTGAPDLLVADSPGFSVLLNATAPGVQVGTPAHLVISAAVSAPSSSAPGATTSIAVGVKNDGPAGATGVTVTYAVPAGLAFVPSSVAGGSSPACTETAGTTTVTCALGSIAAGTSSAAVSVVVAPTLATAGSYASTFTATSAQPEGTPPGDASVTVTVAVNAAPLPNLTAVRPAFGAQGQQNLLLTLTGTGFESAGAGVAFSNLGISVLSGSLSVSSATTATFDINIAANAATGAGDVTLTMAAGQSTLTGGFTVNAASGPPPAVTISLSESIRVSDATTLFDLALADGAQVNDTVFITAFPANFIAPGPVAYYSAQSLGFGGGSGSQVVTLSNIGGGPLTVVSVAGPSDPSFAINAVACSDGIVSFPNTLPSGGVCNFTITYTAPASGSPSSSIAFTDNTALSNLASVAAGSNWSQTLTLSAAGTTVAGGQPPVTLITIPPVAEVVHVADAPQIADSVTNEGISVTDVVSISVLNTLAGSQVVVAPIDPTTGKVVATVTFGTVSAPGTTSVKSGIAAPSANVALEQCTPPVALDVSTTATFSGGATVCVSLAQLGATCPAGAALWHFSGGVWQPLMPPASVPAGQVCGVTATFSPFAVFSPSPQTIGFAAPAPQTYGGAPFIVNATATSGLAVSFSTLTPAVCTVAANTITLINAGTCSIEANQPGNPYFSAALQVIQSFAVNPDPTTITLTSSANPARVRHPVTYTATVTAAVGAAPSNGTVSFYHGKRLLATVALNAQGQASYTTRYSDDDPVSISADFNATPQYLGSVSPVLVEMIKD